MPQSLAACLTITIHSAVLGHSQAAEDSTMPGGQAASGVQQAGQQASCVLTASPCGGGTSGALSGVARGAGHTSTLLPEARAVCVDRASGGAGGTIGGSSVEGAGNVHCRG